MEYRLKSLEYNSLRGMIGEQLARSFIRNKLTQKLMQDEGWDHVLLSINDYKKRLGTWNNKLFRYDRFRDDFIVRGFYANTKLLSKYAMVVGVLTQNHCTPDGLLYKLMETGRTRKLKEKDCPSIIKLNITESQNHNGLFEIPIVDGDIEVIEVKCGRNAKLMNKQKETYNNLISKDVPLRMIKVRFVSFDRNQFLVEEHKYEKFL